MWEVHLNQKTTADKSPAAFVTSDEADDTSHLSDRRHTKQSPSPDDRRDFRIATMTAGSKRRPETAVQKG